MLSGLLPAGGRHWLLLQWQRQHRLLLLWLRCSCVLLQQC